MGPFDICVIGAGPAGYSGAIRAAREGKSVALIEKDKVGGTCLNRGCIPTKALRQCADALVAAEESARFGVALPGEPVFEYERAAAHRDRVTQTLVAGVEKLVKAGKISLVKGTASVDKPGRVLVAKAEGTEAIECEHIVAATGSVPSDLPGVAIDEDRVLSSEGALRLGKLPADLIVVGAGVIGCEWADLMATFGVKVHVVELMDRCLLNEDKLTAKALAKVLESRGVEFRFSAKIESLAQDGDKVVCRLAGGETISAELAIVSVGRRPALGGLFDPAINIATDRGALKVGESGRSSVGGIWGAGDLIGPPMLAHVAHHEMEVVIDNILGKERAFDRRAIPAVVFVRPEIASVGLIEDRAKEQGVAVLVGRFAYAANGKALCIGETEGFAKVVARKDDGVIVGGTVMGTHAADLIQELALAVSLGLRSEELGEVIHGHPTLSEIVWEAAADVNGNAVHKAGRKRK